MKLKSISFKQALAVIGIMVMAVAFFNLSFLDGVNQVIALNVGQFQGHDSASGDRCEFEISKNPSFDLKSDDGSSVEYHVTSKTVDAEIHTAVYAENYGPEDSKWHVAYGESSIEYKAEYAKGSSMKIVLRYDKQSKRVISAEFNYDVYPDKKARHVNCVL